MLTVLIECHNHEALLAQTLSSLIAGAVDGLVSDVILLDHGSTDGTARLADAAGCRLERNWTAGPLLKTARGRWVLVLEPGARPQAGWVAAVADYIAVGDGAASFSPSRTFRRSWLRRLFARKTPFETGLIMPRDLALRRIGQDAGLSALSGEKPRRLLAEIVPAWVLDSRAA